MTRGGVGRREFLLGLGSVALSAAACESGSSGSASDRARPPAGRARASVHEGRPDDSGSLNDGREGDQLDRCRENGAQWPGHRPCRVYLGMSYPGDIADAEALTGPVGVHRSYFQWDDLSREDEAIADDHANRRLPWVSFKPPSSETGWVRVAEGDVDHDLRERARHYALFAEPIVVTFHHEPSDDADGSSEDFAAAWARTYDVMRDEAGLDHVAFVPILGEWQYNPENIDGHPGQWVTSDVLDRAAFLGVDVYQNDSGETYDVRLGRVLDWLGRHGRPDLMIGVGETGCTDTFGSPTAVQWWTDSWGWVEQNTDRVGVVAYFDSDRNSRSGVHWPLTESHGKLRAFEESLASSAACRLPPH